MAGGSPQPEAAPPGQLASFVAGPENRLVVAVVNEVLRQLQRRGGQQRSESNAAATGAWSPPLACPLVLTGPHGGGKTHLAHGLVALWQAARGEDDAAYFTAADFGRDYAAAIDDQRVREFRRAVRGKGLLVIDDVHRLGEAAYRQAELRHTVDAVAQRGGLLLLTAPGPLAECSPLDRPLLSRLSSGLTIEIAPLGIDARRALLADAAGALGCQINADALDHLAEKLPAEAPRVLRAATELRRRAGRRIDVRAAERLIASDKPAESPPLMDILRVVARYHRVPLRVLTGASRKQSVVAARAMAVYLARRLTPLSYADIGRVLSGRDHTTVLHNYRRVAERLPKDRALQSAAEELTRLLSPP
ncbi:MAG: DnaA/Hda family protein [Planctomycetota bacterium]